MPKLTEKCLEAVRAVPIVEVASRYTVLKLAGRQFKGLSPLKNERTPSFVVTPESNRWHCFSTNDGGSTIDLVMKCEHLDMREAVEALAHRFNIALEFEGGGNDDRGRSLRTELFKIHEAALAFFRDRYAATPQVQEYFTVQRGFSAATADTFQVGFAPTSDNHDLAELLLKRFSPQTVRESGLFYAPRGLIQSAAQLVSRFSGRLIIPIHDGQGRVCAFAGRQIPGIDDATEAGKQAKYLNSPETEIFKKSQIVFNLHRARQALKEVPETETFVLVEGPLDVIRLWEAGAKLAIAPQGTAITPEQLLQVNRYPNRLRCLMDGDEAGKRAALRLIPLALETETDAVFTVMPPGQDPDSVLKGLSPDEAKLRLRAIYGATYTPVALAVKWLMPKPYDTDKLTPEYQKRVVRDILEMLSHSPSAMTVWFSIQELAKLVKAEPQAVWSEFARKHQIPRPPEMPASPAEGGSVEIGT